MVTYVGNLGSNQQVYVENQGTQTVISLISSTAGQQQSQSTSFGTGTWVKPPALFRNGGGYVLQIETGEGSRFVLLQANSISAMSQAPSLGKAEAITLQQTTQNPQPSMSHIQPMQPMEPIEPMKPMKPMEPMRMGNMEMQMSPNMEMRMGNMELRMGSPGEKTQATRRFCTQCGNQVSEGDRFCAHCGHHLTPA